MVPLFVAINAKFIHTNNAVRLLKANSTHETEFIEFTIKDNLEQMVETILGKDPLLIGISTYIWNVETVRQLVHIIKQRSQVPVVLGGPEVSYDACHFLKTLPVDVIVKGEGEKIIDSVIEHFLEGTPMDGLTNIAYKDEKNGIIEKPIVEIPDLHELRSPHRFNADIKDFNNRIQYVEASRGCPFNCSYCLSSLEKTLRFFPLYKVKADLSHLLENGAKTIKFLDRTFNANKDAKAIIDFLIENRTNQVVYQFEITGEIMDEALIDHIHAHAPRHLFRFEIGIQSTNDLTNRLVRRRQDNDKLFRLIEKIKTADIIDMHLDLIAGLPGESLSRFKKTFNDVYALGSRELQLGFLKFLRGTLIREEAEKHGYTFSKTAPYTIQKSDVLSPQDLKTIEDVETALNLFHNKRYFQDTLFSILKRHFTDYFDLFKAMHDTYTAEGYPLKGYQIDDIYAFMDKFLRRHGVLEEALDSLKLTFLARSKVKPKCYFDTVKDKNLKARLFTRLSEDKRIHLADLYKHSVVAPLNSGYVIALYKRHEASLYTVS